MDKIIKETNFENLEKNVPKEVRAIDKAISNIELNFFGCDSDLIMHDFSSKSSIKN